MKDLSSFTAPLTFWPLLLTIKVVEPSRAMNADLMARHESVFNNSTVPICTALVIRLLMEHHLFRVLRKNFNSIGTKQSMPVLVKTKNAHQVATEEVRY